MASSRPAAEVEQGTACADPDTCRRLYLQTLLEAPELVGADGETVEAARGRAIELVHPGATAALDAERDAVRLLTNATAVELKKAACDLAELRRTRMP